MGAIAGHARTSTIDQMAGWRRGVRADRGWRDDTVSDWVSTVAVCPEVTKAKHGRRELTRSLSRPSNGLLDVADLGRTTEAPTGKRMLNLFGSIAKFERE